MRATVFVEPGRIELQERPIPAVGPLDALMRITTTTICGTDVHILRGEYPVRKGLIIGHEPVGVIEKLGSAAQGYREGQRVLINDPREIQDPLSNVIIALAEQVNEMRIKLGMLTAEPGKARRDASATQSFQVEDEEREQYRKNQLTKSEVFHNYGGGI